MPSKEWDFFEEVHVTSPIMKNNIQAIILSIILAQSLNAFGQTYHMPGEDLEHEGTWLQWPHNNLYGPYYQGEVEDGWVTMTNALQTGEMVHIIAYDQVHKTHIIDKLTTASVPMGNVDINVFPTDDVWVRDNGPVFVYDENDNLQILDWGFNGWGNDTPYALCDVIPQSVSTLTGIPRIDLSAMVLEGGSIEHDGHGTMFATRSSVTHSSRNPGLSEAQIEAYLTTYLGITNFIWLDGVYGQDITDHHIDGFVKFANDNTIITMDSTDLDYWFVSGSEIDLIYNATDVNNDPYNFVTVPLTQNNVQTMFGNDLGIKGSYCNYYIGNDAILVPIYNDPSDAIALNIIQSVYPARSVVGINVQNLYEYGGMTHCVTQQQPVALPTATIQDVNKDQGRINQNFPNPFSNFTTIEFEIEQNSFIEVEVRDINSRLVQHLEKRLYTSGKHSITFNAHDLESGIYYYQFVVNGNHLEVKKMLVQK